MAGILQKIFSDVISSMKISNFYEISLKFVPLGVIDSRPALF